MAELERPTTILADLQGPKLRVGRFADGSAMLEKGQGFVFGRDRHIKVPQTGRVLIQNDVEIGAGTTIDRGSLRDTVIGEGTKIDNQVQIAHNVLIGRHCGIASGVGIAVQSKPPPLQRVRSALSTNGIRYRSL